MTLTLPHIMKVSTSNNLRKVVAVTRYIRNYTKKLIQLYHSLTHIVKVTLSDYRTFSIDEGEKGEREWKAKKKGWRGRRRRREGGRIDRSWRWVKGEREEKCMWLRTEKEKKKTLFHFSRKLSSLFDLVWLDRFLFLLAQITRDDAAFQDMLRAVQNFLYFSSSVPPKNRLWWFGIRDL